MVEKFCLVTGGSSGVGRAIATGLVARGARVALLSRDPRKAEEARRRMIQRSGNSRIELLSADLSDPASVREAVRRLRALSDRLDVLALCAGVLLWDRRESRGGVEMTLATEFVGQFLLANSLLDLLRAAAPARILTAVGLPGTVRRARIRFDDLQLRRRYHVSAAKLQAARAKALFTLELARRLAGSGVTANAFYPGLIRSGMVEELPVLLRLPARLGMALVAREESPAGVYLACSPEVEGVNGRFFRGRKPLRFPYPPEEAARLWEAGERLAGLP